MLQNDYFEGICVLLLTLNKNNNRNSLISTITFLEQLYIKLKEKLNDLYNHIKSNQISLNEAKTKFIIYKKMKSESVKLKNINKLLTVSNRNNTETPKPENLYLIFLIFVDLYIRIQYTY